MKAGRASRRVAAVAVCVVGAVLLTACSGTARPAPSLSASARAATPTTATPSPSQAAPSPTADPSPSPAPDPIATLTPAERVGQLFMVGTSAAVAQPATLDAVTQLHVGGVFLSGRSQAGVAATAAVVARLQDAARSDGSTGPPLLVATDQEGGEVQVLGGPGFSAIPSALDQGRLPPATLAADATEWARQLAAAGVTMDLAPAVDLVPSPAAASRNPPIGALQREFGFDPSTIESHADAFRTGMAAAGVTTVDKHFPGLGFVAANTDTATGVTDDVTSPDSASVGVFRQQIAAGAPCIMVSSAAYARIAPGVPGVFSPTIVTGLLRNDLGFSGVVMSDDLSAADQVAAWSPAERAILAIEAGVDVVLVSAEPAVAQQMVAGVLAKYQTDPAFAALVDAAARKVLTLRSK